MITTGELLKRLRGVKRAGKGWSAQCPAHEDRRASLSVAEGADGRLLVHCHAGCDLERILEALRVDVKDLFPDDPRGRGEILATYDYTDEEGNLLFQVVRFYPKDFRQRRPAGCPISAPRSSPSRTSRACPSATHDPGRSCVAPEEQDRIADLAASTWIIPDR